MRCCILAEIANNLGRCISHLEYVGGKEFWLRVVYQAPSRVRDAKLGTGEETRAGLHF